MILYISRALKSVFLQITLFEVLNLKNSLFPIIKQIVDVTVENMR